MALRRLPFLAAALLTMAAAAWGGLARLDLDLRMPPASWISFHGALMVSGFLGTLIGLERAVALARPWAWAGPILTVLGSAALLAGPPDRHGPLLFTLGSASLVFVLAAVLKTRPTLFHAVMGAGAASWLAGNVLWMCGRPVHSLVLWWAGFLVLTIAGERLELARFLKPSAASRALFGLSLAAFLAGCLISPRLAGAGMMGLAAWLWIFDLARRTLRQEGLPRFTAACLLTGYAWLGVSGALFVLFSPVEYGPQYDACLHALFLGFVMSMILAHAPLVFPAVLKVEIPYAPRFWTHAALLHASLAVRIAGDLGGWSAVRAWGGALNAAAIALFLLNTLGSALSRPSGSR